MATLRKVFFAVISAVAGFTAQEVLAEEHFSHSKPLVQETTISVHEHTSNAGSIQTRKDAVRVLVDMLGACPTLAPEHLCVASDSCISHATL